LLEDAIQELEQLDLARVASVVAEYAAKRPSKYDGKTFPPESPEYRAKENDRKKYPWRTAFAKVGRNAGIIWDQCG
jgi:hypothetical protein